MSHIRVPHVWRAFAPTMGLLTLLTLVAPAHPQGCSQCRDQVAQTPIRAQTAYRRAIILMVVSGATVFTAAVLTLRRFR